MGIKANYQIKVPTKTEFLETLGKQKDDFILVQNRGGVFDIIHAFGVQFATDLANKLNELNDIDTGKLIESMTFSIKRFGADYTWEFSLNDYYKYIDQNRKPGGKLPFEYYKPKGVIFEWVKRNNYLMTGPKAPKLKKNNQQTLAFLIGRKIITKGRKGNKFFTSTVKDGRIAKLADDLTKALKVGVVIDIKEFVTEIKKK